mmetsp:Transcript_10414/g.23537  ORF Transcript_10414/g.23537 Transcript_10414/m.23537 type:complete len:328 (+) Transcript_10414:60-1043(+)
MFASVGELLDSRSSGQASCGPGPHLACYAAAVRKQKSGDFSAALQEATKATSFAPGFAPACVLIADIKRLQGELEVGLKYANTALQLDPSNARAFGVRAAIKYLQQDLDGAYQDADKAIEADKDGSLISALALGVRASVSMSWSDWEACLRDTTAAIGLDATCWKTFLLRACVRQQTQDFGGSVRDAEKVIELNSRAVFAYEIIAECKHHMQDWEGAQEAVCWALALEPESSRMLELREDISKKVEVLVPQSSTDPSSSCLAFMANKAPQKPGEDDELAGCMEGASLRWDADESTQDAATPRLHYSTSSVKHSSSESDDSGDQCTSR